MHHDTALSCAGTVFVMHWHSLCHALAQFLSCTDTVFVMHWHSLCHALTKSLSCTDTVVVMHWDSRCHALTQSLSCTGTAFVMHWHSLCHALLQPLSCTDTAFVMHWHSLCHALAQSLSCTGTAFVMHWHILCHALTHWLNIFLENTLHPYLPFCHYCTVHTFMKMEFSYFRHFPNLTCPHFILCLELKKLFGFLCDILYKNYLMEEKYNAIFRIYLLSFVCSLYNCRNMYIYVQYVVTTLRILKLEKSTF